MMTGGPFPALVPRGQAVERLDEGAGLGDVARQDAGAAREPALVRRQGQGDQGTVVPLPLRAPEPGERQGRALCIRWSECCPKESTC